MLTNSEIMVMNNDGSHVVNLTRDGYFDGWPAWSPDGRRIAFSSNTFGPLPDLRHERRWLLRQHASSKVPIPTSVRNGCLTVRA
jgi:dipeptidyl aminopeptidase/acylaminoacyl peptidase